jgi:fructose transport system substrate-binding protein
MREGAAAKAAQLGIEIKTSVGRVDGDHGTQVQAIETASPTARRAS